MGKRVGLLALLLIVVMEAGVFAQSSSPDTVSGSEQDSVGPAIHWQTDSVDLRAHDVTLRLGDKTFSPTNANVTVVEDIDTKSRSYITARWNEDGHDNTLRLRFRSGRVWSVVTIQWWVSDLTMPDGSRAWGEFYSSPRPKATRTKVGQTFSGDLEPLTQGRLVPCEPPEPGLRPVHEVDARLAFEGLHLAVTPPQPSLLDRALWFLGLDEPAVPFLSDVCAE